METVSIIIPAYNVASYIEEAVLSAMHQSYSDLQIIIVNDASTDETGDICHRLEKKDSRIVLIDNKVNKGLSRARNQGLNCVTGEYILFLDGDDYLDIDCIRKSVNTAQNYQADVVSFGYCEFGNGYKKEVFTSNEMIKVSGYEAAKRMFHKNGISSVAWGKLYSKRIYCGLNFPDGKIYEDVNVTYKALLSSNNVIISGKLGYFYRGRSDSISGLVYKNRDWDYIENAEKLLSDIQEEYPELIQDAQCVYDEAVCTLLMKYARGGKMEKDRYKKIRNRFSKIFKTYIKKCNSGRECILLSMVWLNLIPLTQLYFKSKR